MNELWLLGSLVCDMLQAVISLLLVVLTESFVQCIFPRGLITHLQLILSDDLCEYFTKKLEE